MATFLKCPKDCRIVPMHVVGERCCAETVLWGMIESSDALRGMDFNQFTFEETETIMLDPGGMMICDDPTIRIDLHGASFLVKRQHLVAIEHKLHPDRELQERLNGWYRIGMGWSNVFIPTSLRFSLYEGVKRERIEQGSAIRQQITDLRAKQNDLKKCPQADSYINSNLARLEAEIDKLEKEERWL